MKEKENRKKERNCIGAYLDVKTTKRNKTDRKIERMKRKNE